MKRICVIGAGAAGLCAARHLSDYLGEFEIVVFEQSGEIGGTWNYTEAVGCDEDGFPIHSSMYANLRTNLPKEVMFFPDLKVVGEDSPSSVSHDFILQYLEDYADYFNLRQFMKMNTIVECVKRENEKWIVRARSRKSSDSQNYEFDAVMICTGHFFDPYIPPIPGLENFKGEIVHSHDYRKPETFTDKKVIILGASSSGIDIAFELSKTASKLYLSHNNNKLLNDSAGIEEVLGIASFENDRFQLNDGSKVEADVLLFCTGYNFTFPFLDSSCGIVVDDNYVAPLYKHLINVEEPSMSFIGIPCAVVPFPLFHIQVKYFVVYLRGQVKLPSKSQMLEEAKLGTAKKRHAHKFADAQWQYNDDLASAADFDPLPEFYKKGFELWVSERRRNLKDYKLFNLEISPNDGTLKIVKPN